MDSSTKRTVWRTLKMQDPILSSKALKARCPAGLMCAKCMPPLREHSVRTIRILNIYQRRVTSRIAARVRCSLARRAGMTRTHTLVTVVTFPNMHMRSTLCGTAARALARASAASTHRQQIIPVTMGGLNIGSRGRLPAAAATARQMSAKAQFDGEIAQIYGDFFSQLTPSWEVCVCTRVCSPLRSC